MSGDHAFIDYYAILRVKPDCDTKALEAAYHRLAKKFHPDRTGSADTSAFAEIGEAYRILRNSGRRAEYDRVYGQVHRGTRFSTHLSDEEVVDTEEALNDADHHAAILMYLYKKRREQAQSAGVPAFYLQELVNCSDDHFAFHQWYLKEKGFIMVTEQGTLAITIHGVDHVISMSRSTKAEKLLLAQSGEREN